MDNNIYQHISKEPILDAKYEKADLRTIVEDDCKHLSTQEQASLLELLQEFEDRFGGVGLQGGFCPAKGRSKTISWPAISNSQKAHGYHQKGNPEIM